MLRLLHLLRDEADADEDGDEQAEDRGGGQPEVLDDLDVLPGSELADQIRRAHQQDREEHEVVEHLVADRLAEHVEGDQPTALISGASAAARPSPRSRASTSGAVTCRTKKSSSVSRIGLSETSVAPAAARSASTRSGAGSSGSSTCVTAVADAARSSSRARPASAQRVGRRRPPPDPSREPGTPASRSAGRWSSGGRAPESPRGCRAPRRRSARAS